MLALPQRRPSIAAVASLALIVATLTATSDATATISDASATSAATLVTRLTPKMAGQQMRLDAYSDRLRAAAAGTSGFAGLSVDPVNDVLDVWWHGSVPTHTADLITHSPAGLNVRLNAARFSQQQLDRAADTLLGGNRYDAASQVRAAGIDIHTVAVLHDGSGLEVRYIKQVGPTSTVATKTALTRLHAIPEVALRAAAPRPAPRAALDPSQ